MNGAFPRHSLSTPFIKPQQHPFDGNNYQLQQYYRTSIDESFNVTSNISSSSSSSSNSSRQSYSPPNHVNNIPSKRVLRKPVSNNPHHNNTDSPALSTTSSSTSSSNKYTPAVGPVHRSRLRTYSQVTNDISVVKVTKSISTTTETETTRARRHSQGSALTKPNFWYPRSETDGIEPLKRGLSKKIKGLLQPHKTQIEKGVALNQQYLKDYETSMNKWRTPSALRQEDNPFFILSHTQNESDINAPPMKLHEIDFVQTDSYASTVQQRGPLLTPSLLSQKFLVRPYKRDLFRLRSLFIWLIQNIRPEYHQKRIDLMLLQKQSLITYQHQQQQLQQQQQHQQQLTKSSNMIKQKLSKITHLDDASNGDDQLDLSNNTIRLDSMDLLQEELELLIENANDYINESADQVLETRTCKSSFGMAHLFATMAVAAGFEDCQVVHGYLKAPKDTIALENNKLPINHAWCSVKVEGEYRFIDCWLASPFYPQNENKLESHWFLSMPTDMILTHLPKDPLNQFLNPPITQHAFFSLPHVRSPYFWHRMRILSYKNQLSEDGVFYVSLKLHDSDISCYAETEGDEGQLISRGLAQCLTDDHSRRICKIKAVLPPNQSEGWLKIYSGKKSISLTSNQLQQQQQQQQKHNYQLSMCIRISQPKQLQMSEEFNFVQLYIDHNEFYVQEPQCYKLYPLQTYQFCIRGNRLDHRATHHKLAVKSPNGKLFKLMYSPQDQTYDGNVTITESGKWTLICLLHHTGGWYTVANWYCDISIKKRK